MSTGLPCCACRTHYLDVLTIYKVLDDDKHHLIVAHEVTNLLEFELQAVLDQVECTNGSFRRIRRWENEDVIDAMKKRLDRESEKMHVRR